MRLRPIPTRGLVLLVGLAVAGGAGARAVRLARAQADGWAGVRSGEPRRRPHPQQPVPVGRAALVLVGTVTPMFAQALNVSLSIGEPYFQLTFAPMMAVLLLFMPLAPAAPWRKAELAPLAEVAGPGGCRRSCSRGAGHVPCGRLQDLAGLRRPCRRLGRGGSGARSDASRRARRGRTAVPAAADRLGHGDRPHRRSDCS